MLARYIFLAVVTMSNLLSCILPCSGAFTSTSPRAALAKLQDCGQQCYQSCSPLQPDTPVETHAAASSGANQQAALSPKQQGTLRTVCQQHSAYTACRCRCCCCQRRSTMSTSALQIEHARLLVLLSPPVLNVTTADSFGRPIHHNAKPSNSLW